MIRRSVWVGFLAIALAVRADTTADAQTPAPAAVTPGQVDAIFSKWNRTDSPGCALAVMQGGHVIYKNGYGMADLSHDVRITSNTPFHVASVSKQFAAAAILLLAGQKKLSLDDDIRRYLPEMHDFGTPITVRHLLHHTSGLRDQWDLLNLSGFRYSLDLITDEDVMYLAARQQELNFPPGSEYSYSNTGYTLLGQIVKRVSGQSLREVTTRYIFEPLGMNSSYFRDDHAQITKGEAFGYVEKDGTFKLSVTNFDTVGATSLYTTVEDLAKWDENFYAPRVGGADFTQRMTHTDKLTGGKDNHYAMGLILGEYRGLPVVEHSGADAGYRANIIRFPGEHFSVACLCNTVVNAASLTRQVADLYLSRFAESKPAVTRHDAAPRLPQQQIAGKAGYYRARDLGVLIELVAEDGMLQLVNKGERAPLRTDGNGNFLLPDSRNTLRFDPVSGEAERLVLDSSGQLPQVWDRMPAFSPPEGAQRQLIGTYYSEELDVTYRIEERQGKLVLIRKKYPDDELVAAAPDVFGSAGASTSSVMAAIQFTRDANGRVFGMTLTMGRTRNVKFVRRTS